MAGYHFHYTSRQAAQGITASGGLIPGPGGVIYVSPDLYSTGSEVTDRLAIAGKPVEIVGLIPDAALPQPLPPSRVVLPLHHPVTGVIERHGGGAELRIPGPVHLPQWWWLGVAPP